MESHPGKINQKRFFWNIVLPTTLTFALFILLIFAFIIPYFKHNMLDSKKEMIKELVNSATGIASKFYEEEKAGVISREDAQQMAISRISHLRYGVDNKDYFWITDNHPRMIMHPYRQDLNGDDLTNFTDPEGKKLFVEMTRIVKADGNGYVDYMWQWMDDSSRTVPKISYVSEFKPWSWIIGTGIYIEDVRAEIALIIQRLLLISLVISLLMALFLTIIVRNNLKAEIKRSAAENQLKVSRERYKALVEASTDGTLLFVRGKCTFANKYFRKLIFVDDSDIDIPDFSEIIHPSYIKDLQKIMEFINGDEHYYQLETFLIDNNKQRIPVLISFSQINISGEKGHIAIVKDLNANKKTNYENILWKLADNLEIGAFIAQPGRKARFVKANSFALKILGFNSYEELLENNILDMVENHTGRMKFIRTLTTKGAVKDYILKIRKKNGAIADISVTATLEPDEVSGNVYTQGIMHDVTSVTKNEEAKDEMLALIQSCSSAGSMLVKEFAFPPVTIDYSANVADLVSIMQAYRTSAVFVTSDSKIFSGIITDKIIRESITDIIKSPNIRLPEIMQSPIHKINENDTVVSAITMMHDKAIDYLAVVDNEGIVNSVVSFSNLSIFSYAPAEVIYEKINNASDIQGLAKLHFQMPVLVRSLISGGAKTNVITRLVSETSDNITRKLAELVIREIGKPPVEFTFICMGSEGRAEQTFVSDQDNAVIYADPLPDNAEFCSEYFLRFGEKMNYLLSEVGYELCKGNIMANNLKWNQPLSKWKQYFNHWISLPEPQNILDTSIFFDFRFVYGNENLTRELVIHINEVMNRNPNFLAQMARACISYKVPLSMFGRLQTESGEKHGDSINLKNAVRVIVSIARLYAMKYNINARNTLLRMKALEDRNVFSAEFFNDITFTFDHLMILQFRNQVKKFNLKTEMDNYLNISELSEIETEILKSVLSRISTFQTKTKFDFGITGS